MKNPTDLGKTVENGVDPCLPNSRAQLVNLQQLANVT